MPKQIIRYQCEHCRKKAYVSKYDAVKHEKKCFFNPAVRSCVTCDKRGFHPEYGDCWCAAYQKEVIKKGSPIRDCPSWREVMYEIPDGGDYD